MATKQKIYFVFILLFILLFFGTFGYMVIEDMDILDSLYMTIITISTVGFGEVQDLSMAGRIFTIMIIISGLFIAAFAVTVVSGVVIEGEFGFLLRRRKMGKSVDNLKNHHIICGVGNTGNYIVDQFLERGEPFVGLDLDPERVDHVIEEGGLALLGDATREDALIKAGIKQAKGLLCCLSNDAENVFTVLTARGLNPDLYIVSRAIDENACSKLMKAGADKTVSPNEIGGVRMASMALRPAVVSFLDVVNRAGDITIDLEEVTVKKGSSLDGVSLLDARIPEKTGLILAAIRREEDHLIFNPSPHFMLRDSDVMIVMGNMEQVARLEELAG